MTTNEIIAKLKTLANKAGETLYERVKLVAKVLADKVWLDTEMAGDHDKALETLEVDCFPELSAFGLAKLLEIYRIIPDLKDWRRLKWNIMALWAETQERLTQVRQPAGETGERRRGYNVKEREEVDSRLKSLEFDKRQATDSVKRLEMEVERLQRENDELRGEVKALNRMVEQLRQGRFTAA